MWECKYSYMHSRCEGKSKTLTRVKSTAGFIFGGYTSKPWRSPVLFGEYKEDPYAFMYTLKNPCNIPMKLKVIDPKYAVYHVDSYGPTFGLI